MGYGSPGNGGRLKFPNLILSKPITLRSKSNILELKKEMSTQESKQWYAAHMPKPFSGKHTWFCDPCRKHHKNTSRKCPVQFKK